MNGVFQLNGDQPMQQILSAGDGAGAVSMYRILNDGPGVIQVRANNATNQTVEQIGVNCAMDIPSSWLRVELSSGGYALGTYELIGDGV